MDKLDIKIIRNFGPSVLKVKIPEKIVNHLNNYVDETVKNKEKSKKQNAGTGLVGDVTQEIHIENKTIKESGFGDFLAMCASKWIEIVAEKKITKFEIINSWVVRQFENEYNPTHWHSGHISGAGFLKVPSTLGTHKQEKKDKVYRGGNLQLIHGSKMFLCASTLNIEPKVGDFYFFPNYMMHSVFPFKNSKEERRSISFNANIDNEIYNVYGKN